MEYAETIALRWRGERAAIIYTLVETAKLDSLDPEDYPRVTVVAASIGR